MHSIAASITLILSILRLVLAPSKAAEGITRLMVALRAYHWDCCLDWTLSLWLTNTSYGWRCLTEWDPKLTAKLSEADKARLLFPSGEGETIAGRLKDLRFSEYPEVTAVIQRADGTWRVRFDGLVCGSRDYEMVKVTVSEDGLDLSYEVLDHTAGLVPLMLGREYVKPRTQAEGPFKVLTPEVMAQLEEDEEEDQYW